MKILNNFRIWNDVKFRPVNVNVRNDYQTANGIEWIRRFAIVWDDVGKRLMDGNVVALVAAQIDCLQWKEPGKKWT